MKQKIKDCFQLLKNVFIPQKSTSYLSVFQRTIAICLWIMVLFIISSAAIEAIQTKSHWLSFLENIFIGVSCSAFVVIVTVYLQFISEHTKLFREHNSALLDFLFYIGMEIEIPSQSYEDRLRRIEKITATRSEYMNVRFDLIWYDPKKDRINSELIKRATPIIFASREFCVNKQSLDRINITSKDFNEVVDAAVTLADTKKTLSSYTFNLLRIDDSKDEQEGEITP